MQCPGCGTIWPDDCAYCSNCGTRLDKEALSAVPTAVVETGVPVDPSPSITPLPVPPAGNPYMEPGWAEFSGTSTPAQMSAGVATPYPPLSSTPGTSIPYNNYPYTPGSVPPGFPPPITPKRRGPLFVTIGILSILVLVLVFGGIFVGIRIGQAHSGVTPTQVSASPTAGLAQDPAQLYQQVTSQNPSFVDGLKDPTLSTWAVFEKPTYGCEIKKDGLHVHIKDTARFGYCTSGRGKFSNFAFQVEMKILSGNGGGIVFREDANAGNLYVFHVYPDGSYHIYMVQNHKATADLNEGTISSFASSFSQENTLTVIALNSRIYLYANQKFLTQIQDSTYSSGYLGVLADDHTTPAEVIYTNAQIWML